MTNTLVFDDVLVLIVDKLEVYKCHSFDAKQLMEIRYLLLSIYVIR